MTTGSGLVIVDKPSGLTSHDVVGRIRKLAGTRRVGHAGTLDPMATGVLVIGVQKATRMLGYLALTEKDYVATIRLGQSTDTDDADGQIVAQAEAAGLPAAEVTAALQALTGEIRQVPPGYSAIKVAGERAYRLARAGAAPELAARAVTVRAFTATAMRPHDELLDLDVAVTCSSGTYIRALARDLGAALGVGGHLTALRRTRVGPYRADMAGTLDELATDLRLIPLAQAAASAFPRRDLTEAQARLVAHGGRLPAGEGIPARHGLPVGEGLSAGEGLPVGEGRPAAELAGAGPVAAFAPDGTLIALLTEEAGQARPLAVFVP